MADKKKKTFSAFLEDDWTPTTEFSPQYAGGGGPVPYLEEERPKMDFTRSPSASEWFDFSKKKRK